jgi:hypothetical protein
LRNFTGVDLPEAEADALLDLEASFFDVSRRLFVRLDMFWSNLMSDSGVNLPGKQAPPALSLVSPVAGSLYKRKKSSEASRPMTSRGWCFSHIGDSGRRSQTSPVTRFSK